jgi:hypothetical protein
LLASIDVAGVPTAIGDTPSSHSCYCWFPCYAGILLLLLYPLPLATLPVPTPATVAFLMLLVSLLLLVTLYHWLPSLLPRLLLLLLASLLLLANVSLLKSSAVTNLI